MKVTESSEVPYVEHLDRAASPVIQRQLSTLGFLSTSPDGIVTDTAGDHDWSDDETQPSGSVTMCDMSELCDGTDSLFAVRLTSFVKVVLESCVLFAINRLYDKHQQCLNVMIDSTFVAANDVACTPPRLKYARDQEVSEMSEIQWY